MNTIQKLVACIALATALINSRAEEKPLLDKDALLQRQSFWDNKDWDWYKQNIPFFESPDAELDTTYYYRWELVTKHLVYGSPNSGYSFTEFIDRPFWSGAYGAISCPSGHQLYEIRWLKNPQYAQDYARYWFRTPGAQPRNYSTWLADAVWALHTVHTDKKFVTDLLPDLIKNYDGWVKKQWVKDIGMFWQHGHDDGMEFNINSRQTKDILRGANGYRPSFNSYMWADAMAISRVAELSGDTATRDDFKARAAGNKNQLQTKLWDPKRQFFFPMSMRDEQDKDGHLVKALTLTYQSGQFAGNPHGREEIGYIPWQFNLPDKGFEPAWKFLMDSEYFYAERGPTTVERNDPMFLLKKSCCWWSGQSWPYATTQTLKAMANLLQNYDQKFVSRADYFKLLRNYALSHRKNGKPYLAEALHPDTGSFEGHDGYNHSEHYFHSGFCDLVVTGLVGLKAEDGDVLTIDPLAPPEWDYFALDDLPFRGHRLSVVWDKKGNRYGLGAGLHVLADGKELGSSPQLSKLVLKLAAFEIPARNAGARVNFAVNNDGDYYPRMSASFVAEKTTLSKINDGNYWYHKDPPNRWTCEGSPNASDWVELDLGAPRNIDTVKFYVLDDSKLVVAPKSIELQYLDGADWKSIPAQKHVPQEPTGHRANLITFAPTEIRRLRAVFTHAAEGKTGLTEIEVWGNSQLPYTPPPHPAENLAYNPKPEGFPKASASFSDVFGGKPDKAIDGKIIYLATPMNRWTSYGSPNDSDWLEVDFGKEITTSRVELAIYDDHGGVQPPQRYTVQFWDGKAWKEAESQIKHPEKPAGRQLNEARFTPATTSKLRIVFTHAGKARSGVTELFIWKN